jgi:DNA-binding transcriptional MerR regulator
MPRTAYAAAAARRAVGISQRCLDYWDERGIVQPSITQATGKGSERAYSFDDLLKLSLVKRLREAGLSLQRIQKGLAMLRKRCPKGDVLLDEVLVTDGSSLFRRIQKGELEDVLANGQLVFSVVAVGRVRDELSDKVLQMAKQSIPTRGRPARSAAGI